MKKNHESWLIVTNKWTYIWLVLAVCAILKIPFYDLQAESNYSGAVESLLFAVVCGYLFIRINTYSEFWNPDHPKPQSLTKK